MSMRPHSEDPAVTGGGAFPGTRPSHGSAIIRTLRIRWWPRFLAAGVVLVVVGVTLLSGTAQAIVALLGTLIVVFGAAQGLAGKSWDQDRRREPPVPPGSPGGGGV
jgi:hypothetical protein